MILWELLFWSLAFYGAYTILEDCCKWVNKKIEKWRKTNG